MCVAPAGFGRSRVWTARRSALRRRLLAVAVMVLTSCSGESGPSAATVASTPAPTSAAAAAPTDPAAVPTDPAVSTDPDAAGSSPSTTASSEPTAVDRYRAVLDASGVTIDDRADAAGASPFVVPSWQLASLSAEATAGGGIARSPAG